mgnify:FL=1
MCRIGVCVSMSWQTVWAQKSVPVIWRRSPPIWVRLPYLKGNREWMRPDRGHQPEWNKPQNRWQVPASWFNQLVDKCLDRFGAVYIIEPHRPMMKCAPACRDAKGHICECSCLGANHGSNHHAGWYDVSETFSFKYGQSELMSRRLTKR